MLMQVIEDHKRVRELWRQYNVAGNTTQQKRLLALDIIRHSCIHSKKEDMVRERGRWCFLQSGDSSCLSLRMA